MRADHWEQVSRIYHEARAVPAGVREAFVRDACAGDAELEGEVRSLLAQPSGDSFMNVLLMRAGATRLDVGGKLGRFELRGLLGAGGMGEVYRALDPGLGRDVALKIVPTACARDPDRLRRLQREARVLATLNHPNIATIYGVEEIAVDDGDTGSVRALVLELVEGETLADRLGAGPIPVAETCEIARQIAEALEAAHEKGIVHRDLKPANVTIRSDGLVKVLDFGLAKAEGLVRTVDSGNDPPDAAETSVGAILGTPAYMSPEQARGLPVDKRADIWAFGCLLYEMLCGRPVFTGDTPSDVLAAVLRQPPEWSILPHSTPASLRRLLHRCLEQNPKRRLRDIGDARLDLEPETLGIGASSGRQSGANRAAVWATIAAALVLLAMLAAGSLRRRSAEPPPMRFTVNAGAGQILAGVPVPSPDGRYVAFVARTSAGESALWVRPLESANARRLAGTENAANPFWAPDSNSIGFAADGVLKRTALESAPVQRVTSLDPTTMGATWNRENVIVFTPSNRAPLHRVAASGGDDEPLTVLDTGRRENSHRWPYFFPDGRHFLFTARSDLPEHTAIYAASLDRPQSPKRLVAAQSGAIYVSAGYLLFARDDTLLAQRFDADALELVGEPLAIAGGVSAVSASSTGEFAASADGAVVSYINDATSRLVWFDRRGMETGTVGIQGSFGQVRLAPDGSHAAVILPDPQSGNRDVWVVTLSNGGLTRLTSHPASDWFPVWSPDGTQVLFASDRDGTPAFYRASTTGAGGDQLVFRSASPESVFATDWSSSGGVLFHSYPRGNISLLPLGPGRTPTVLVDSPFTDWLATFSPDGRWIAYVSDESGTEEVYVRDLPGTVRHRVSASAGAQPRWRRDGRELFFLSAGNKLMSVAVNTRNGFAASAPKPLFTACPAKGNAPFMYRYDITADGARSLWICESSERTATIAVHGLTAPAAGRD
jgi:Tol biopolymer transport system component